MVWKSLSASLFVLTMATVAAAMGLDPGLEVWWTMDGDLTDSSGHGRTGTVSDGLDPAWGTHAFVTAPTDRGQVGQALELGVADPSFRNSHFLGSAPSGNAFVSLDYVLPDNGTIAMWHKTCEFDYAYQSIFDNSGTDATRPNDDWEMWIGSTGKLGWRASKDSANGGTAEDYTWAGVMCKYDMATQTDPIDVSSSHLDTWLHLTASWERLTYDSETDPNAIDYMQMKMYINGVLVYTSPGMGFTGEDDPNVAHHWQEPGSTFYLGGGNYFSDTRYNTAGLGVWDEVAIWSRQLTDAEVAQVYNEGVVVPCPCLLLGDANEDRVVDDKDASILAVNWKQSGGWADGDFNNDTVVDEKDASILASHWGNTYTEGMAVPEPSTIALLLGALVSLALLRRK